MDEDHQDGPNAGQEEIDLYAILGVEKSAPPEQIKKAYRKAALQYHPDKVDEEQRSESEAKFKAAAQAYEILGDDQKRAMYDAHGMAAFDGSRGGGGQEDELHNLFSQMFGFGSMGGGGGPRKPKRGPDEVQEYKVTLEELYKGKTVKFAANKRVVCGTCKGSGAKENVQLKSCDMCRGVGVVEALRQVGPGLLAKETVQCDGCEGTGKIIKEKDRCKKCKGKRTVSEDKVLEIFIPRGTMQGETIVLEGEADQSPDQTPGNLSFTIVEERHDVFSRIGNDLSAELAVTLSEALCGFSRVVLTHLDGRGIHITRPCGSILRPGDVLRIPGEGMPPKRGDERGDLYLVAKIEFPDDDWLNEQPDGGEKHAQMLRALLPGPKEPIVVDVVDEVEYEDDADLDKMGEHSGDPRFGGEWEDVDEEDEGGQQCQPQ